MLIPATTVRHGRTRGVATAVAAIAALGLTACQLAAARPAPSHTARSRPHATASDVQRAPIPRPHPRPRIMLVGDSITAGSAGDYTWQFRLYKHLFADGVRPRMVGPYGFLFDNVTGRRRVYSYADPHFQHANDALWGMALSDEKDVIGRKVANYRPDYLLVLLGLDDLFWKGLSQPVMALDLASFIAAARAAKPHIRFVFGLIPPDIHEQNASFAANVASFNHTIIVTAKRLSTAASPIAVAHDGAGINVAADLWDGTHPNSNGEIRIAAGFADALASRFHLGRAYPRPYPVLRTGPLTHPKLTVRPMRTAGRAVLSWTLAPGAGSYYVYLEDVTQGDTTFTRLPYPVSAKRDPWTAGLLAGGDTYIFKVQACKGIDCNAFSNPASVTIP